MTTPLDPRPGYPAGVAARSPVPAGQGPLRCQPSSSKKIICRRLSELARPRFDLGPVLKGSARGVVCASGRAFGTTINGGRGGFSQAEVDRVSTPLYEVASSGLRLFVLNHELGERADSIEESTKRV